MVKKITVTPYKNVHAVGKSPRGATPVMIDNSTAQGDKGVLVMGRRRVWVTITRLRYRNNNGGRNCETRLAPIRK